MENEPTKMIYVTQPCSKKRAFSDFPAFRYLPSAESGLLPVAKNVGVLKPLGMVDYPTMTVRPACAVATKFAPWRSLGIKPVHCRGLLRHVLSLLTVEGGVDVATGFQRKELCEG